MRFCCFMITDYRVTTCRPGLWASNMTQHLFKWWLRALDHQSCSLTLISVTFKSMQTYSAKLKSFRIKTNALLPFKIPKTEKRISQSRPPLWQSSTQWLIRRTNLRWYKTLQPLKHRLKLNKKKTTVNSKSPARIANNDINTYNWICCFFKLDRLS